MVCGAIDSAPDSPSVKRFAVVVSLFSIVEIALLAVVFGYVVPSFIWASLSGIVVAGLGLSVWEKINISNKNAGSENANKE